MKSLFWQIIYVYVLNWLLPMHKRFSLCLRGYHLSCCSSSLQVGPRTVTLNRNKPVLFTWDLWPAVQYISPGLPCTPHQFELLNRYPVTVCLRSLALKGLTSKNLHVFNPAPLPWGKTWNWDTWFDSLLLLSAFPNFYLFIYFLLNLYKFYYWSNR